MRKHLLLSALLLLHLAVSAQQVKQTASDGDDTTSASKHHHKKKKKEKNVTDAASPDAIMQTLPSMPLVPDVEQDNHAIKPYAMPMDNKLVVFPFDPNYVYPILSRKKLFTRIALEENETVIGFYLSDQLSWIHYVAKTRDSVYVMPMDDNLVNTATLKTTKHTYDLSFKSVPEPGRWYQRVSWHIPLSNFEEEITDPATSNLKNETIDNLPARRADGRSSAGKDSNGGDTASMIDVKAMNFNYTIEGSASFRPTMVFDDGQVTWLKLPDNADAPVFFALSKDGTAEPVRPYPRDGYMVVQQPLPYGLLLKINKDEVRIKSKKFDCGWFNRNCGSTTSADNISR